MASFVDIEAPDVPPPLEFSEDVRHETRPIHDHDRDNCVILILLQTTQRTSQQRGTSRRGRGWNNDRDRRTHSVEGHSIVPSATSGVKLRKHDSNCLGSSGTLYTHLHPSPALGE